MIMTMKKTLNTITNINIKFWFVANLILKFFDLGTTYYFVKKTDSGSELNPVVRWSFNVFGIELASVLLFCIVAFLAFRIYKSPSQVKAKIALVCLALVTFFVVINNFVHIFL